MPKAPHSPTMESVNLQRVTDYQHSPSLVNMQQKKKEKKKKKVRDKERKRERGGGRGAGGRETFPISHENWDTMERILHYSFL